MFSLKMLFALLGVLNLVAVGVLVINTSTNQNQVQLVSSVDYATEHQFVDQKLASYILDKLDIPKEPYETENPKGTYLGLKRDSDYCRKVRENFIANPHVVFEEINFLSDYLSYSLTRNTLPLVGTDTMPNISYELPQEIRDNPTYDISININTIFTNQAIHGRYLLFGKELVCMSQSYNHIPGINLLNRKDMVAKSANAYAQKFQDKPQCFDGNKFFPRTWLLDNIDQCTAWFNIINSKKYEEEKKKKSIVYIRKLGAGGHEGKGVEPVHEEEEAKIREIYDNGKKCGQVQNTYIVQNYIHNPLLVVGHKFDFRVYLLIASTNPLIAYYHDGFLRVSLIEYDVTKNEKGMHLTNTAQSKAALEKAKADGMNETELMNFQMWNYTRLANFLIEEKKIQNLSWIDDYLRPAFHHAMQHLIRMTQSNYYTHSSVYEMFGVDFMLDEDLNLWFIECNSGPALKPSNDEKRVLLKKMLKDMFEIMIGLARSRMKRVVKYVNWMITNELVQVEKGNSKKIKTVKVELVKSELRKKEFDELMMNKFEEEYEISSDNGWQKIVDENYEGLGRYNGNILPECFDQRMDF